MDNYANVTVERYLRFLRDQGSLVDIEAIEAAEERAAGAETEVERLLANRDLRLAKHPDPTKLRDEFRKLIPKWAEGQGVSLEDLLAFPVPKDDLAGMVKTPTRKPVASKGTQRAVGSIVDERIIGLLADGEARSIKAMATDLTVSETAVRKSISRLEVSGRVVGTVTSNGAGGRPFTAYHLA